MDEYHKTPPDVPPKEEGQYTPPNEHDSMEDPEEGVVENVAPLKRSLKGRHMQMIAIVCTNSQLSNLMMFI